MSCPSAVSALDNVFPSPTGCLQGPSIILKTHSASLFVLSLFSVHASPYLSLTPQKASLVRYHNQKETPSVDDFQTMGSSSYGVRSTCSHINTHPSVSAVSSSVPLSISAW